MFLGSGSLHISPTSWILSSFLVLILLFSLVHFVIFPHQSILIHSWLNSFLLFFCSIICLLMIFNYSCYSDGSLQPHGSNRSSRHPQRQPLYSARFSTVSFLLGILFLLLFTIHPFSFFFFFSHTLTLFESAARLRRRLFSPKLNSLCSSQWIVLSLSLSLSLFFSPFNENETNENFCFTLKILLVFVIDSVFVMFISILGWMPMGRGSAFCLIDDSDLSRSSLSLQSFYAIVLYHSPSSIFLCSILYR